MNKSKIIFITLAIVMVLAAILSIILMRKDDDGSLNNNITNDEQVEDSTDEDETLYATGLTVNLPMAINILVGEYVELLPGYFSVSPSIMTSEVKQDIKPRYNCSPFGLELLNSKLIANEVGTYNFKISVPRSEGTEFNETILITVYEDTANAHITQTKSALTVGESLDVNNLFFIKEYTSFTVETDAKLKFENNKFIALNNGVSDLCFTFTTGYVKHFYNFNLLVKEAPKYTIVVYNAIDNQINVDLSEDDIFFINYDIQNAGNGDVEQKGVVIEIFEESIVTKVENGYPLIKFRALKAGTTKISLTSEADINTTIEITIVVK